jgi:hypothetical protein
MSLIFLHPVFGDARHTSVITSLITGPLSSFHGTLGKMNLSDAEWNVHAALCLASTGDNRPKFGKFISQQLPQGRQVRLLLVNEIKSLRKTKTKKKQAE